MASRQEEKEQRRREREEAERAHKAAEARRKRLGIVLGGVLALAVAAIVVVAVLSSGDGDSGSTTTSGGSALPKKQTDDLQEAASAAGCTVKEFPDEGNQHLSSQDDTFDKYKTNPPTSGTHRPPPASDDGVYVPGRSPDKENWVHTLEHGRVIFQYAPGTPEQRRGQLETLMNEEFDGQPSGFKTVILENNTKMPFEVAAVAWRAYVGCKAFNDKSFDALRAFRTKYVKDTMAPEPTIPWPQTGTG